ncbi:MAG: NAD(P)H-dependent oxidoreductase [Clostridia bacterium]|nr:NAD(P)H-dependent oxidoreductase [Clostridia bacterium]
MKKRTVMLLAVLMVFILTACSPNPVNTEAETLKTENTGKNDFGENSDNSQLEDNSTSLADDTFDTANVLVAYFSATNTTEGVAQTVADILGADLYEIMPEQPYTDADLNYHDDNSRSTIEMNDPNARPAISGSVENMEEYDIVFIGYPIWWGEAPRILNTFVESYDFSDKTVVPFCTSGGSGVGSSASNLERLTSGAVWLSGTRLNGNASRSSVADWIDGLELDITAG